MTRLDLLYFRPFLRPDSRPTWPYYVALGLLRHHQVAKHIDGQLIVAAEFLRYGSFNSQVPPLIPSDGPCSWYACIDLHLSLHPTLNSCVLSYITVAFRKCYQDLTPNYYYIVYPVCRYIRTPSSIQPKLSHYFQEHNSIRSYQIWKLPKIICLMSELLYSLHKTPFHPTRCPTIAPISSKWCDPRT